MSVVGLHGGIERLVALGLDAEVAETYLRLLMQGPARPAAFSKVHGFSRSGAYRHLERLAKMGLATASSGRPVVFEAAEPEVLFEILEEMCSTHAAAVEQTRRDLESLTPGPAEYTQSNRTFRHLVGRRACHEELHRVLDRANEEVLVVDTNPTLVWAYPMVLWSRLERQAQAGLRHQIVVSDGSSLPAGNVHDYVRKLAPYDRMKFVIVDRQAIFLCITDEEQVSGHGPPEQCLSTSAPGLVAAQLALFERLWDEGTPLGHGLPASLDYKISEDGWQGR